MSRLAKVLTTVPNNTFTLFTPFTPPVPGSGKKREPPNTGLNNSTLWSGEGRKEGRNIHRRLVGEYSKRKDGPEFGAGKKEY